MNAAQHDRARAVIEAAVVLCPTFLVSESLLYTDAHPATAVRGYVCDALGELALAAGHTVEDLLEAMDPPMTDDYTGLLPKLVTAFGLDEAQCDRIVGATDEPIETLGEEGAAPFVIGYDEPEQHFVYDLPPARKAAVLKVLASFVALEAAA